VPPEKTDGGSLPWAELMVVQPNLVNTVFFLQKYMNDPISHPIMLCYFVFKRLLFLLMAKRDQVGGVQVDLDAHQSVTLIERKFRMPQIQGVKGEAVVSYREPLTTQEMGYHELSRRVNKMKQKNKKHIALMEVIQNL
jgi:hypothetical protein